MRGGPFTWCSDMIDEWRVSNKIDSVFKNEVWNDRWFEMFCDLYGGGASDHF